MPHSGYDADGEHSSGSEEERASPAAKMNWLIQKRLSCRSRKRRCQIHHNLRRRLEGSPIHPDIDFSRTKLLKVGSSILQGIHSEVSKLKSQPSVASRILSRILQEYSSSMSQEVGVRIEERRIRIENPTLCKDREGHEVLHKGKHDSLHFCRPLDMESALALSQRARLLLESERPHRVVHANAAYGLFQSKEASIEKASPCCVASFDDVKCAARAFFGERHVLVYPVCGSDGTFTRPTHYLLELSSGASFTSLDATANGNISAKKPISHDDLARKAIG